MLIYQNVSNNKNINNIIEGFYDIGVINDSSLFCNNFKTYGLQADTLDKQNKLDKASDIYCSRLIGENIILIEKMNIMEKFKNQLLKFGKNISVSEKQEYDSITIHFNFYTNAANDSNALNKIIAAKLDQKIDITGIDLTNTIYHFYNNVIWASDISNSLPSRIDSLKNLFKNDILNVQREVEQLYNTIIINNNTLTDSFEKKKNYIIPNYTTFYNDLKNTQNSVNMVEDYKTKLIEAKYITETEILKPDYKDDILELLILEKKTIDMLKISQENINNLVDKVVDNGAGNTVDNGIIIDNNSISNNDSNTLSIILLIIFIISIILIILFFTVYKK